MGALENVTTITVSEYKLVTNILPKVPEDTCEFMPVLKTFTNLLYTLFSSGCPLYQNVHKNIKALYVFKQDALRTMSAHTKASILQIILLQTCHFAVVEATRLAEFKTILEKLAAKDTTITYAEVPAALMTTIPATSIKPKCGRDTTPVTPDSDNEDRGKRLKKKDRKSNKVHLLLNYSRTTSFVLPVEYL